MLEAVVAIALRAIVAGVVLGGALALVVLAAIRLLALSATTRHSLWTTTLIAIALMPLASIGVSLWRGVPPVPAGSLTVAGSRDVHRTPSRTELHASVPVSSAHPAIASGERGSAETQRFPGVAVAGWAPRLPHQIALGIAAVWLGGAAIGLGGLVGSIARVRGLKQRSSPLDGTLVGELPWLTDTRFNREIYLRLSYETETPVAIGFRRPVILIPTELAASGGLTAIESLILHEHAHLLRRDDWTNLIQRSIERIFWFNPVVWLVGARIALEREIASDDAVVERTGAAHAYATSLWRLAREMRMPEHAVVAPGALLTRKQISVRIEQLLDANRARLHRSPATALGVAFTALLAVAAVATSAPAVELPVPDVPAAPATQAAPAQQRTAAVHDARAVKHQANTASTVSTMKVVRIEGGLDLVKHAPPDHTSMHLERVVVVTNAPHAAPAVEAPPSVPSEIANVVSDAVAGIPFQIAQAVPRHEPQRSLAGTTLTRELIARCIGCSLHGMDLRGLDLHGLALTGDDLSGADLSGVNLAGAKLMGVSLKGANVSNADLTGAQLTGVELSGANLTGALLENVHLTGVSLKHAGLGGTALHGVINNCTGCDLSHLDLRGQDLQGIRLNGADLSHSDLRGANLSNARLTGVDLSYVNLGGSNLSDVMLEGCDLAHADLTGTISTGLRVHATHIDW